MSESKLATIGILLLMCSLTYGQAKKPSVLLPPTAAQSVSHFCSRAGISKVSGSWHPTQTELERLESHLMRISKLKSGDELRQVQIAQRFLPAIYPHRGWGAQTDIHQCLLMDACVVLAGAHHGPLRYWAIRLGCAVRAENGPVLSPANERDACAAPAPLTT